MIAIRRMAIALLIAVMVVPGCRQAEREPGSGLYALAGRAPGDVRDVLFYDLRPEGAAGRTWAGLSDRLRATQTFREMLDSLFGPLKVEELGVDEWATAAARWSCGNGAMCVAVEVDDPLAVEAVLIRRFAGAGWEQEAHHGQFLYHGRDPAAAEAGERLAWAVDDGYLLLAYSSVSGAERATAAAVRGMLDLAPDGSLAAQPVWQALRGELPESPAGAFYATGPAQWGQVPPAGVREPGIEALVWQISVLAGAVVAEEDGLRAELRGRATLQPDAPPEVRRLFESPAIDPASWTGLPADVAVALAGRDGAALWPVLSSTLNLGEMADLIRQAMGVDVALDLAPPGGPLSGELAVALTPPLADQPIVSGVPAVQLLVLARGATEDQAAAVRAAAEWRGATWAEAEVEGMAVHTEVGTELSGYALTCGFDGDTLVLGSSPTMVGRAVMARRDGTGLTTSTAFQRVRAALPGDITHLAYVNAGRLADMVRANMPADQQASNGALLEALAELEAIGLGLRLGPEEFEGALYFLLKE